MTTDAMNNPDDEHRHLQQRLEEAGRAWQPRHPGWDTLIDRLPEQDSAEPTVGISRVAPGDGRFPWRTVIMAATVLVAFAIGIALLTGPDRRAEALPPIEVQRRGVQVTIFNASASREPTLFMPQPRRGPVEQGGGRGRQVASDGMGMALVRDQRLVLHLRAGNNTVKFMDVAASIDPTSVRLVSDTDRLGTRVVEQNFEFDLASADGILDRSIERKIVCLGKDSRDRFEGVLLGFDNESLVLADELPRRSAPSQPRTHAVARAKLRAIRVAQLPANIFTRPTLVWVLRTEKPGDHLMTLTYLCGDAVWRADYVAVLDDTESEFFGLDLKGWVTIDNRSGATYDHARLKLIAGDVNRVRDPWAPVPRRSSSTFRYFSAGEAVVFGQELERGFTQKDFFEYKLYTLSQPSTIRDRQIKQLDLFKASRIKGRRRYLCRSTVGLGLHPEVRVQIENRESNNLGRPLPKGTVAVMARDSDGDLQLLGRREIGHTPKDEKINISMRGAFDVVYDYRIVRTERPSQQRLIQTHEFRVRNHKTKTVSIRLVGKLAGHGNAKVTTASAPYERYNDRTLHFDFHLKPDSEKTVSYTVDYSW